MAMQALIVRSNQEDRGVDAYNGYYVGLRSRDESVIGRALRLGWKVDRCPCSAESVHPGTTSSPSRDKIGVSADEVGTQNRAWAMFQNQVA